MANAQKQTSQRRSIVGLSILLVLLSGIIVYLSFAAWHQYQATPTSNPEVVSNDSPQSLEASERTPPPANALQQYQVAADEPRIISIAKLGIAARIMPMGLNENKSIQAPRNIYDAGWYRESAKPGEAGAVFIDGHSSGASTRQGLFGSLDLLKNGDTIGIEKGNGEQLEYTVVHKIIVGRNDVDMSAALLPYSGVEQGLTLMSCIGVWDSKDESLSDRVIIFAKQI